MGPQVREHRAASVVYKRPNKYPEEFNRYASPALINRSGVPSTGEVGLNIRMHTTHLEPAVLTGRLGPKCVITTRTQAQQGRLRRNHKFKKSAPQPPFPYPSRTIDCSKYGQKQDAIRNTRKMQCTPLHWKKYLREKNTKKKIDHHRCNRPQPVS